MGAINPHIKCPKCSGNIEHTGKVGDNGYEIGECVDCGYSGEITDDFDSK